MNIIAYGSLMNQSQLEQTLGRPTALRQLLVPGVSRIFNAPFDNFAYLNLQTNPSDHIEAAYFKLEPNELSKFAVREAGSILIEIIPGYFAFTWPAISTRQLPVAQSYIDICQSGADQLGIKFTQGLIRPKLIIQDHSEPVYC